MVRGGTSEEGLPIGVQIVSRPWREDVALAVAQILHVPGVGRCSSSGCDHNPAGSGDNVCQADRLIDVGDNHPSSHDVSLVAEGQGVGYHVIGMQDHDWRHCLADGHVGRLGKLVAVPINIVVSIALRRGGGYLHLIIVILP